MKNAEKMQRQIIKIFFLLFIAGNSFAQTNEQKILNRVKQLNDAIFLNKDSVALDRLLAGKLSYGHSGGKIENREEMIHNAVNSPTTYKNFIMDSATVFFERNTAFVRHVLKAITNDKGKEGQLHLSVLQVWIKQNKQWKLTARQSVKL